MAVTIRDPIHGSIHLDDWAVVLVDHPVMQRLRRIQQLGTAHLLYPGARHSRFEHSLGAHHLAGRMARSLRLSEEDARVVRAASLLHDVGHGPFSHAFDEMMRETGRRHEETGVDLIQWGPLGDLLRQGDIDPRAVAEAVLGKGRLAPIVSGTLDADRMDYLLRDAHYTGVRSSVDAERVAVSLRLHNDALVLSSSGVIAAEALLTMRFLMYPAVYLHRTVRASEAMLQEALRAYTDKLEKGLVDVERRTDDEVMQLLRADPEAADLARRLDERRLYKAAFEGNGSMLSDDNIHLLQQDGAMRRKWAGEIAEDAGVMPHDVLLDVPRAPQFREVDLPVLGRNDTLRSLGEVSTMVAGLQTASLDHWRMWVFAPRRHHDVVAKAVARFGPLQVA